MEMASAKFSRNSRSSSVASRPPTTDSEDLRSFLDNDDEEDDDEEPEPLPKKRLVKSGSYKRQVGNSFTS